ncbi:MAG: tRNA uracil 4-sulfurtransferase ThiI [Candidatus Kerfeldbacteria bacterium]
MKQVVVANIGELVLKGGNRRSFEGTLLKNIDIALKGLGVKVKKGYGIITISGSGEKEINAKEVMQRLQHVFGIASLYAATEIENDAQAIENHALQQLGQLTYKTFAIRVKRTNKKFPVSSGELEKKIGAAACASYAKDVDLTDPDVTVHIRIAEDNAMVYAEKISGAGGLPVGTGGKMLSLISSGIDSPVASSMMMRRGASVHYIHFHSYPATSRASAENAEQLVKIIQQHQPPTTLAMAPFHDFQKQIIEKAPAPLRVVMYRRGMYAIADALAGRMRVKALISGESLGQVASQTVQNMTATSYGLKRPVFRPLIGMDKQEIVDRATAINTYETSIRPYDDCCSFLVPEHVETSAKLREVLDIEQSLPWNEMISGVLDQLEVKKVV